MVSENNEWAAVQKVVRFGYGPFYCECFTFSSGLVLFCWAEGVRSDSYDFFHLLSASYMRMASHMSLASVVSVKSCVKSGNEMTGGNKTFLIFSKALLAFLSK